MRTDPAFCTHAEIKKSTKIETISVPELGIEQLVLRIRVYCKDCKAEFVPKTIQCGFSTEEVGALGNELIVPLEYPQVEEDEEPEGEPATRAMDEERPPKEHLH